MTNRQSTKRLPSSLKDFQASLTPSAPSTSEINRITFRRRCERVAPQRTALAYYGAVTNRKALSTSLTSLLIAVCAVGSATPALAASNLTVDIGPGLNQLSERGTAQYRANLNLRSMSYIYYERPSPLPEGVVSGLIECESVLDPKCQGPGALYSRITAPACDQTFNSDCVARLAIVINGKAEELKLHWNPDSGRTKGSSSPYTPIGALPPLYELPDTLLGPGIFMAPLVQNTFSRNGGYFSYQGFSSLMTAVKLIPGEYQPIDPDFSGSGWSFGRKSESKDGWSECLWTIPKGCIIPAGELPQVRIQLVYRSGMPIGGWWHSRIDDPTLTTRALSNDKTEITVEGKPSILQGIGTTAILTSNELKTLRSHPNFNETFGNPTEDDLKNLNIFLSGALNLDWRTGRAFSIPFAVIDAIKRSVDDKSDYEVTDWSISTLFADSRSNPCYKSDRFQGLIATNSLLYSAFPPALRDGNLEYEVGGVHKTSEGKIFKGKYTLVLSNELAKCLYSISSIPPTATLQITSDDGTQNVSTIVVNSDSTWTTLRAEDFTFSKKVIGISLGEKKSSAQEPVPPSSESNAKGPIKRSITCVKGDKRKFISALKPKCPKGFKKI